MSIKYFAQNPQVGDWDGSLPVPFECYPDGTPIRVFRLHGSFIELDESAGTSQA